MLRLIMRWSLRIVLLSALLTLLAAIVTTGWLVASESGSRVSIAYLSGIVPGFSMRYDGGTLTGPLQLKNIVVKNKKMRVEINRVRVDWAPSCLLVAEVCLRDVDIDTLHVTNFTPPAPAVTGVAQKRRLPTISLPLDIDLSRLAIANLDYTRGDKTTRLTDLEAALAWQEKELRIDRLVIGMPNWEALASGTLNTSDDWPLTARLRFFTPRTGETIFALSGVGAGSLAEARLLLESEGLLQSKLEGTLQPLEPGLPFSASVTIDSLQVPPRGAPASSARLRKVSLHAQGLAMGEIVLDGTGTVETPWTPPLTAELRDVRGTWRGIEHGELLIDDPRLLARVISDYQWLGGQQFRATVDLARLDLTLLNRALPSRLQGRLQVNGSIKPEGTRIDIAVEALSGTLKQWPMTARGAVNWYDTQWHFDPLKLTLAGNTAVLAGTLGPQWNATAALTLDDLQALQPAFAGSASGQARISGEPAKPVFTFDLDGKQLQLPAIGTPAPLSRKVRLPAADWKLTGHSTLQEVTLTDAHTLDGQAFRLKANGTVNWAAGLRWDLALQAGNLSLQDLLPELTGTVGGDLHTRGALSEAPGSPLANLHIDTQLQGVARDLPLTINTDIDHTPARTTLNKIDIRHGDNHLLLNGAFDAEKIALNLDLDAPVIGDTLLEARGSTQLQARIDGPRKRPEIDLQGHAGQLAWRDLWIESLDANGNIRDGAFASSSFSLHATGVQKGNQVLHDVLLEAEGMRSNHRLGLHLQNEDGELQLAVSGALQGDGESKGAADLAWDGQLDDSALTLGNWRWYNPGSPSLNYRNNSLAIAPHCWTDNAARACITRPALLGRDGQIAAEFFHLPLETLLTGLLPIDTRVQGQVGGVVSAAWQAGEVNQFRADIRNANPLMLAIANDDELRSLGSINHLLLDAQLDAEGGRLLGEMRGDGVGDLRATATLGAEKGTALDRRDLKAQVLIKDVRLDLLEAFTYQLHEIGGTVGGEVDITGSLLRPSITGDIALADGRAAFTRLPLNLVDINVGSHFNGEEITFSGGFRTPESTGLAQVTGELKLMNKTWQANGRLTGSGLVIAALPDYQFTLAPNLTLNANSQQLALDGTVHVPAGRIEIKSLPTQSVSRSRDVILVREAEVIEESGITFRQRVDVQMALGNDVRFRAFGGEGRLSGGLRVRSRPELPLFVNGELHVHEGKYKAFGQSLNLKQADIIFNGPAEQPLIDALASRSFDDGAVREVGLRLTGSLRAPETTLWSTPALPDEEALSWLATGRPLSDGPINLRGEAAQAALSLGIAQGSALLSAAGQEIGLNDVQLATGGDGEDAEVQIGTNVNERIFVGYNRRVFTGDESILLRWHLSRRLMLEALSGLDSALDIFYTFEF